jgi:uncharacterized protein involved in exopolysaccharide biosynthesis
MPESGLNLTDVVGSVRKHSKLIVAMTVLTSVAGVIFYMSGHKKYEAKTEFVLRNPMYNDRNNIYNFDARFIDYFGNEDDVDRLLLMSGSDIVQGRVIRNMHLAEAYGIDAGNRKGEHQVAKRFEKNFNIARTEYKDLIVSFDDEDPARAASVANNFVKVLDTTIGDYYADMRRNIYRAIQIKMHQEDSTIDALTDTLVGLRGKYNIYDIISPSRNNIMLSPMKDNGNKEYGKGVEMIQNIESLKDQVVSDRARQTSLVNQYETGFASNNTSLLKVVTEAKEPVSPKGLGGFYTLLASAFLGFFFSVILMSFIDRYINPVGKEN